ncbi:MAG: T9SS type A sorting domain-containing protein [Bacteroidales bacterium]|nr:T9SS type A sorting domain-containing protein [Bacteroidales bacterium]
MMYSHYYKGYEDYTQGYCGSPQGFGDEKYLYNMRGQLLKKGSVHSTHIDVGSLPEGCYLLRVSDHNGSLLLNEAFIKR